MDDFGLGFIAFLAVMMCVPLLTEIMTEFIVFLMELGWNIYDFFHK